MPHTHHNILTISIKLAVQKKGKYIQEKTRKRKCRSLRTSESNLLSHFDEHKNDQKGAMKRGKERRFKAGLEGRVHRG